MHATLPVLTRTDFPALRRAAVEALQVNLGCRRNQSCVHGRVNAGPQRTEERSADTIAAHEVEVVASMPCHLEDNVDHRRGKGTFEASIRALQRLNALEHDYKRLLGERHGVVFKQLFTLANMPIQRFGSMRVSKVQFNSYMSLRREAHRGDHLPQVICRSLLGVDRQRLPPRLRLQPATRAADPARWALAPAPVRGRRRAAGGRTGPGRRPLLRLHRRAGFELRRCARSGDRAGPGLRSPKAHWSAR